MRKSLIHRHTDPGDTLGGVVSGLIMALASTMGARLVAADHPLSAHQLIMTVIGCNIAWGVIDAALLVLGGVFHRSERERFFVSLRRARSETEAMAAIEQEFSLEDEPLALRREDRALLHQAIRTISAHAAPVHVRVRRRDLASALVVFVLVSVAALPAVIPFLLVSDADLALHLSNVVQILVLFAVGCLWGRYTAVRPWQAGVAIALLGIVLVFVLIAL
jgi:hypothetical protein